MTVAIGILRRVTHGVYAYWCPGCQASHSFDVHAVNDDGKRLGWDGDHDKPTVDPDLTFPGCRHQMRAGVLTFTAECTHALAGTTLAMTTFPQALPDRADTPRSAP
jgi:hypothetical protein